MNPSNPANTTPMLLCQGFGEKSEHLVLQGSAARLFGEALLGCLT
jgi:hypothetical protein